MYKTMNSQLSKIRVSILELLSFGEEFDERGRIMISITRARTYTVHRPSHVLCSCRAVGQARLTAEALCLRGGASCGLWENSTIIWCTEHGGLIIYISGGQYKSIH